MAGYFLDRSHIYMYQIITLCTLNLYNVKCQLHLSKAGEWH